MTALAGIPAIVAALAIRIPLSIYLTAPIRRDRKLAQRFALAAALFFGFAMRNRRPFEITEEAKDETKQKKDQTSGEPPTV